MKSLSLMVQKLTTDRQTDKQTDRQDKNNMPPIIRSAGIETEQNKTKACIIYIMYKWAGKQVCDHWIDTTQSILWTSVTSWIWWRKNQSARNNKSPKGHWSLTWVQWAILLKVRFLSKSESMTAIFVKSVRTATIAIFQFRIRGCIRFVAIAFRSEEEVLWRRNPSLTYFWQIAPPPGSAPGGVCRKAYKQVRDYEYFISIKFRKHPSSGSAGKADYEYFISIKFRKHPSSGSAGKADYVFQYIYMD